MNDNKLVGPIERAVQAIGSLSAAARTVGKNNNAVRKWIRRGRLPRTEATGETRYAEILGAAQNVVSSAELLATVYERGTDEKSN